MQLPIEGQEYFSITKMTPFEQLAVARKLAPAIALVETLTAPVNANKDNSILSVIMLSYLSDADSEFIVHKCLTLVRRKQSEDGKIPPAPIVNSSGGLQFDDLSLKGILELTVAILKENVGDFFRTALDGLPQADQPSN